MSWLNSFGLYTQAQITEQQRAFDAAMAEADRIKINASDYCRLRAVHGEVAGLDCDPSPGVLKLMMRKQDRIIGSILAKVEKSEASRDRRLRQIREDAMKKAL